MSALVKQLENSQGLLGAMTAITHRRAFITLYGTYALVTIIFAGGSSIAASLHSIVLALVGFLVAAAVGLLGFSATGFMLNDTVRGRESQTIIQAIWLAIATVHRLIGALLVLFVLVILAVIVVYAAVFVCKIPSLGPLLFALVFPVSAVLLGMIFFSSIYVLSLNGPAIWNGNGVFQSVSLLVTVFRERLFQTIVQMVLLSLLVVLVGSIVVSGLVVGISMTGAFSAQILGPTINLMNPTGLLNNFTGMGGMGMGGMGMGGGDLTAYLKAGVFGLAILGGLAITIPALVAIAGTCIVFASVTENLSTEEMDQLILSALDSAREKTEHARRQIGEARAKSSAQATVVAMSSASCCPKCSIPCGPSDVFCGNCGQRIA